MSAGEKSRGAIYPIHIGSIGGRITQLIWLVVALFSCSLPITGFYIWWSKKKK
ncbi:PepSY domain-containing protein [Zhouia sp. PK063]|uniref:PepSY domain-containing protein n=1 Tax=Zhouia sp. PK063 TaxID=3373602 RepID=UPI0037B2C8AE